MSIIKPNRTLILKEAALRALNQGELAPGVSYKSSQTGPLEGFYKHLDQVTDPFEQRRSYVDAATGTGKGAIPVVIARHAHRIAQEKGIGDTFRIFIGEPSIPMLYQAQGEFKKYAPEVVSAIGIYGDNSHDLSKPITILTHDSRQNLIENNLLDPDFIDLSIDDEAHRGSLSVRRQNIVNQVLTDTFHLGFTASSEYDREKTMNLTHRNRIYHLTLKDAVELGLIADYIQLQYSVIRLLPHEMRRRNSSDAPNIDFTFLRRLEWARMVTRVYRSGVDEITGRPLSDKIALFFAADTTHADNLANMLNADPVLKRKAKERGFKDVAVSIHTRDMSRSVQAELQKEFESGLYMAGVGDKKFQAGFNYPRVKYGSSYPGESLVDTIQEGGRPGRQYINPITGESEGAVIQETVIYVGDPDPRKDEAAKQAALKKITTMKDVLSGETLILRKGRPPSEKLPGPKIPKGPQKLSIGSTYELFTTEEETLTISRQIDKARAYTGRFDKILSIDLVLNYVQSTYDKTRKWPSQLTEAVWQKMESGEYQIVEDETWVAINHAIGKGQRGLIDDDGSPFAESLPDLLVKTGLTVEKQDLTIGMVRNYIRATHDKTGRWPTMNAKATPIIWQYLPDDGLEVVRGETGFSLDYAIRLGNRGLAGGDGLPYAEGLADFLVKEGFKKLPNGLTIDLVRNYIQATFDKTDEWLSRGSEVVWCRLPNDEYKIVERETGSTISDAVKFGRRGLIKADGSTFAKSLADLLISEGFEKKKPQLTIELIANYTQATYEKTGKWLSNKTDIVWQCLPDGAYEIAEDETGWALDEAIKSGHRGVVSKDGEVIDSLYDFHLKEKFKKKNIKEYLTIELLKNYITATHHMTNGWLSAATQVVWQRMPDDKYEIADGIKGAALNQVVKKGIRGSDGAAFKGSLPRFLVQEDFRDIKGDLTEDLLRNYFLATYAKTRKKLSLRTKAVWQILPNGEYGVVKGETGRTINYAIENKRRGLIKAGGAALAKNLEDYRKRQDLSGSTASLAQEIPAVENPDAPVPVAESFEMAPITAADVAHVREEQKELPRGIDFAAFTSPFFQRQDMAGDTMLSCLKNAQRDFAFGNRVGLRANLRKFAELFAHSTFSAAEGKLDNIQMPDERRGKATKIIRDYHYTCAEIEVSTKRHVRLELPELMNTLRNFMDILGAANQADYPVEGLFRRIREINAAGSEIHMQFRGLETVSDAQLLQNGFELAMWFNIRFKGQTVSQISAKAVETPPAAEAIQAPIAEKPAEAFAANKTSTTKPTEAVATPPELPAAAEEPAPQPPPSMLPSILKAFGVTVAEFAETALGLQAQPLEAIATFAQEWAMEDPQTKRENNRAFQSLYADIRAQVEAMLATGENIQAVADELNRTVKSRDSLTGSTVLWSPTHLLRGAVLNNSKLPLDSFMSRRPVSVTISSNGIETPKP